MKLRVGRLSYIMAVLAASLICFKAEAERVHGVLRVVKGDVQIKSPEGKTSKARIGGKVYPQDTIITGKDARVKVVMVDNNEINVSPESQVTISNYEVDSDKSKKNVLIDVIYGKVRNKVNQKYDGAQSQFQVKTPSAVAGVRGTDFITGFNSVSRETQVITFHGQVAVGLPGANGAIVNPVFVNVGQMTTATAGQAPSPPAEVPKADLVSMDSHSDAEKSPDTSSGNSPREPSNEPGKGEGEKGPKADGAKSEGGANGAQPPRGPASATAPGSEGPKGEDPSGGGGTSPGAPSPRGPAAIGGLPGSPAPGTSPGGAPPPPGPMMGPGPMAPAMPTNMMRPEDFASGGGATMPPPMFDIPPTYMPPPMPYVPGTEMLPPIQDIIQNGNTKLIINVNSQ